MSTLKKVGKREFVKHTCKYLKLSEELGGLIITHHNQPKLYLTVIKAKTVHDLKGLLKKVIVHGDINDHILPGYDLW